MTLLDFSFQGFVKVVKNKAYFKRYEVKFRRRRGNNLFYKEAFSKCECINVLEWWNGVGSHLFSTLQRVKRTILHESGWLCRTRTSTTHPNTEWLWGSPTGTSAARSGTEKPREVHVATCRKCSDSIVCLFSDCLCKNRRRSYCVCSLFAWAAQIRDHCGPHQLCRSLLHGAAAGTSGKNDQTCRMFLYWRHFESHLLYVRRAKQW